MASLLTRGEPALTSRTSPGSQSALADLNRQRVLTVLASTGPSTQAMLARSTGLSRATISNVVQHLQRERRVRTSQTTSSGRRAVLVELHERTGIAVGIELTAETMVMVLTCSGSGVLARRVTGAASSQTSLGRVRPVLERLLTETGLERSDVIGVGAALPGPVDRRTGRTADHAEGWNGHSVSAVLERSLELPVLADSAANLSAFAHARYARCPHLLYVKVDSTVSAGLVLNGEVHHGHLGLTGQIGHTEVPGRGLPCTCGNRDCLEATVSTRAILAAVRGAAAEPITVHDLLDRARSGDAAVLRLITESAEITGRACAALVNLINPQRIVLGGPFSTLGADYLEAFSRGLLRHAVPEIGATTEVTANCLGDDIAALGAGAMAEQESWAAAR